MQYFQSNKEYIEVSEVELSSLFNKSIKFDISKKGESPIISDSLTIWGYKDSKTGKYLYPYIFNKSIEESKKKEILYLNYSVVYHCIQWLKNLFYSTNFALIDNSAFDTIYLNPGILNTMFEDVDFEYPDWDYYLKDFKKNSLKSFVISSSSYDEDSECYYPHYLLVHKNKPTWYTSYFERLAEPKYVQKDKNGNIYTFNEIGCIRAFNGKEYYRDDARGLLQDALSQGLIEDTKYFSMKVKEGDKVVQSMWDYDEMMYKLSQLTKEVDYDGIVYKEKKSIQTEELVSV